MQQPKHSLQYSKSKLAGQNALLDVNILKQQLEKKRKRKRRVKADAQINVYVNAVFRILE